MSAFEVTPGELQRLAAQLHGLLDELSAATTIVSSSSGAVAQNAQLEGAIDRFSSEWRSGLGEMQRKLDEVGGRLAAAATAYEGVEHGIVHALGH